MWRQSIANRMQMLSLYLEVDLFDLPSFGGDVCGLCCEDFDFFVFDSSAGSESKSPFRSSSSSLPIKDLRLSSSESKSAPDGCALPAKSSC